MIHVIMDEGELVGLIANLKTTTIVDATRRVDEVFRRLLDTVPNEDLEKIMCQQLGIAHPELSCIDWHDVLMAYLIDCGGTPVDYRLIEATPAEYEEPA